MIARRDAQEALQRALTTGGDFAELFAEDTLRSSLQLLDGRMENALAGRDVGAGIRILHGLNCVYAYTNDTSRAGLLALAEQAASALSGTAAGIDVALTRSIVPNIHPIRLLPLDVAASRKADALRAAHAAAKAHSPEIGQVSVMLAEVDQSVFIANSEGLCTTDRRVRTRFHVQAVATDGTENQIGHASPGAMRGYEFIESLDTAALGRKAALMAVTMLHADNCPAGVMPVVIDGGFGGVIFHEACGHALEAAAVARDASVFCGKLGQAIAADIVTAIDDGTQPGEWGSINIDDEGNASRRNVLIENGILKGYMIDRLNGKRMGMEATGSSRRQSYAYAPTSRMTNTFIAAGGHEDEEMIASLGEGLYAKTMGGGSVNPATGEFNFNVAEGYLVKDGRIARPVRGASLIGKGSEVLLRIDRVGKNVSCGQGMCGASSGSIPTNVGQPRIRVTHMTIGGR